MIGPAGGGTAVLTGKDLMDLKAAYESDQDDVFDKLLKKVTKKGTFYFAYDVFTDHWSKLTKSLAVNKGYGSVTEEGSFAISPVSINDAKKIVKKVEAEEANDSWI